MSGMKSWYLSLQALFSDCADGFLPMDWVRTCPSTPSTSTLSDAVDRRSTSSAQLDRRDPPRRSDASLATVDRRRPPSWTAAILPDVVTRPSRPSDAAAAAAAIEDSDAKTLRATCYKPKKIRLSPPREYDTIRDTILTCARKPT